jgi:signal transduction histidine kinase
VPGRRITHVDGDRVQIEQVLLNLITNGRDAMDAVDRPGRKLVVSTDLGSLRRPRRLDGRRAPLFARR